MSTATFPSLGGPLSGFIPGQVKPQPSAKRKSSHVVDDEGESHVIIRNVEMFSEVDDRAGDGLLGKVDREKLEKIAHATNANFSRGRHVGVILTHSADAKVVGLVSSPVRVGYSERTGKHTIYGDMRMSRADFSDLLASGRYPRRSAEISPRSLAIHNVSLLGRQSPAADIPDVVFESTVDRVGDEGSLVCYAMGFHSHFSFEEDKAMLMDRVNELLSQLSQAISGLDASEKQQVASRLQSMCGGAGGGGDGDSAQFAAVNERMAQFEQKLATMTAERDSLTLRVEESNLRLLDAEQRAADALRMRHEDRHRAKLAHFKTSLGYAIDIDREVAAIMALPEDKRDAHYKFITDTYRRTPTGESMAQFGSLPLHAVDGGADGVARMSKDERDEIIKFASNNGITNFAEAAEKFRDSKMAGAGRR